MTILRFIPFSVWVEEVSETQIFKFYEKIVKSIIMISFTLKRTQVTLLKSNTSSEYQGMSSRAFLRKFENRLKMRFSKMALELNPFIRGTKNFTGVLLRPFRIEIKHRRCSSMHCKFMCAEPKNHKCEDQSELWMVPLIFSHD